MLLFDKKFKIVLSLQWINDVFAFHKQSLV